MPMHSNVTSMMEKRRYGSESGSLTVLRHFFASLWAILSKHKTYIHLTIIGSKRLRSHSMLCCLNKTRSIKKIKNFFFSSEHRAVISIQQSGWKGTDIQASIMV